MADPLNREDLVFVDMALQVLDVLLRERSTSVRAKIDALLRPEEPKES